jgi:hypothetical protein
LQSASICPNRRRPSESLLLLVVVLVLLLVLDCPISYYENEDDDQDTFEACYNYRSEELVHFGEPIRVAGFVGSYETRRKECIHDLNSELERRLQSLIVHLPKLEQARVVEAVKRLYLERLKLGNWVAKEPDASR